jgi:hypothetical protein
MCLAGIYPLWPDGILDARTHTAGTKQKASAVEKFLVDVSGGKRLLRKAVLYFTISDSSGLCSKL